LGQKSDATWNVYDDHGNRIEFSGFGYSGTSEQIPKSPWRRWSWRAFLYMSPDELTDSSLSAFLGPIEMQFV